jgi:hypothetical protein
MNEAARSGPRLASVDALRGLAVAAMLLVRLAGDGALPANRRRPPALPSTLRACRRRWARSLSSRCALIVSAPDRRGGYGEV